MQTKIDDFKSPFKQERSDYEISRFFFALVALIEPFKNDGELIRSGFLEAVQSKKCVPCKLPFIIRLDIGNRIGSIPIILMII